MLKRRYLFVIVLLFVIYLWWMNHNGPKLVKPILKSFSSFKNEACKNSSLFSSMIEQNEDSSGNFSRHRCVGGGSSGSMDTLDFVTASEDHKVVSCDFRKICYDAKRKEFIYFTSRDDLQRTPFGYERGHSCGTKVFGEPIDVIPEPLTGIKAREVAYKDINGTYRQVADTPTWLSIRQVVGEIPTKNVKWVPGDHLVTKRWGAANWGHALVQNVLPSYVLMEYFGSRGEWLEKDINILFLDDCFDETDLMIAFPVDQKYQRLCHKHCQHTFGLLSRNSPLMIQDIVSNEDELICFDRLLAGTQGFSFLHGPVTNEGGKGAFMPMFSEFVAKKNRFDRKRKQMFRITLIGKGGVSLNSRGIANTEEVFNFLTSHYGSFAGYPVEILRLEVEKATVKEQARIISSTDLLIGPGGATGMSSIFLPPFASMILVPFCSKGKCVVYGKSSSCLCKKGYCCYQLEDYFYYYLRANVLVFPVDVPNDIVGKCDCDQGACKDCNVKMNLTTLDKMVLRGLHYSEQLKSKF